jgi:protein-tyrosine phosphatase
LPKLNENHVSMSQSKILMVCVGNVCRSPVAERALSEHLGTSECVVSAGLGALVGKMADQIMYDVAEARGLSLEGHEAQQIDRELVRTSKLILVMEAGHRRVLMEKFPEASGRVMLLDHWTGGRDIEDPYRRGRAVSERVYEQIMEGAAAWAPVLKVM